MEALERLGFTGFVSNKSFLPFVFGSPNGIRTRVLTLRGLRPRPLVDGAANFLAGEPGFEPRLPDPESGVLPLHHTPKRPDLSIYGIDMTSENYIGYLPIVNPKMRTCRCAPEDAHREDAYRCEVLCRWSSPSDLKCLEYLKPYSPKSY